MAGGTVQTESQARVVDPVLTTVAREYQHPMCVGGNLFPDVPVAQRGGQVIHFEPDDFKLIDTERAPGSDVLEIQFGYTGKTYGLVNHAIAGKVPLELLQEARAVPGIDLGSRAVRGASKIIKLGKERKQATLATTATNYNDNNKMMLAGKSQWDHADSDPSASIATAISAVREAIGMRPNTIVMSGKIFDKIRFHPKLLENIKYTSREGATLELLATLWDVAHVYRGDAVYKDDAGKTKDIWGNHVIVAYTAIGSMDMGEPSFGYNYQLNGYPMVEPPYFNNRKRSWMYTATEAYQSGIVGADAGFLLSNVLS